MPLLVCVAEHDTDADADPRIAIDIARQAPGAWSSSSTRSEISTSLQATPAGSFSRIRSP